MLENKTKTIKLKRLKMENNLEIKLVVACILADVDNRICLSKRQEGKSYAGFWEFPGGKVEKGETPEDAIIRELQEELGIIVHKTCLSPFNFISHTYEDFHLLMPIFICRKWEGFVIPQENQEIKWVKAMDLNSVNILEADKPLIPFIHDFFRF